MGGLGSGGWHGSTKQTVEHCRSIDVRRWAKGGMLECGAAFTTFWGASTLEEATASISVQVLDGALELRYTQSSYYSDEVSRRQTVPLTYTACHIGGKRVWFKCPRCYTRRAKLYLGNSGFYCRICYKLPYYSQQCGHLPGIAHQMDKISRRLCNKMGRAKRDGLEARYQALDHAYDDILWGVLSSVVARTGVSPEDILGTGSSTAEID